MTIWFATTHYRSRMNVADMRVFTSKEAALEYVNKKSLSSWGNRIYRMEVDINEPPTLLRKRDLPQDDNS